MFRPESRNPDFRNMEAVLSGKIPQRPTLFEFFLNGRLYGRLADKPQGLSPMELSVRAFDSAGYDYATIHPINYRFSNYDHASASTISLNECAITDRKSFDRFPWKNPKDCSWVEYNSLSEILPSGMKVMPCGPSGVLENTIDLLGYENLCALLYDQPELVSDVFEQVGSRLVEYYSLAVKQDFVGMVMVNDDWGFNTQTMLSPKDMRKYVFPWHKKIVELAHAAGKPAILHSCGCYKDIIEDVICDMKFDGRHSYEDNIVPIEKAYEQLKGRIAVLGGIDVDFMVSKSPEEISRRSLEMVKMGMEGGGYALGTGNSVPEYIPDENYFAMISQVFDEKVN